MAPQDAPKPSRADRFPAPSAVVLAEDYLRLPIAGRWQQVSAATLRHLRLPMGIDDPIHWRFRQRAHGVYPERFVAGLRWGRVFGYGVVITPTNEVVRDVSAEFYLRSDTHSLLSATDLPLPTVLDARLAVVSSIGSPNYYHWLMECLPRLSQVDPDEVDLYYVNIETGDDGFQRELLRLVGVPDDKLHCATPQTHVQARTVIAPSLPGAVNYPSAAAVAFARRLIGLVPRTTTGPERIYVSRARSGRRFVLNEEAELWPFLEAGGFVRVEPSDHTVVEQIAAFRDAKVIVGPFGAGLTNMVFAPPGALVVECFPPQCMRLNYWALAEVCGHDYAYLLGAGERPPEYVELDDGTVDVTFDMDDLRRLFATLGL